MTTTLHVLYAQKELRHDPRTGMYLPEGLYTQEAVRTRLEQQSPDTFLHAQLTAQLAGAKPYPFIALFNNHSLYHTSAQLFTVNQLEAFPITNDCVSPLRTRTEELWSIAEFVVHALEILGHTKHTRTNLVMDCTIDNHYRSHLAPLKNEYNIEEIVLPRLQPTKH